MGCVQTESVDNNAIKKQPPGQNKKGKGKKMVQLNEDEQYSQAERMIVNDPLADVDPNPQSNRDFVPMSN